MLSFRDALKANGNFGGFRRMAEPLLRSSKHFTIEVKRLIVGLEHGLTGRKVQSNHLLWFTISSKTEKSNH